MIAESIQPDAAANLYLGSGGPSPRLAQLAPPAWSARRLLDLPAGQSIYAVDYDPLRGLLVAGSRAGRIYCLDLVRPQRQEPITLYAGAGVMAVAVLDGEHMASADAAGRCLIWDLASQDLCGQLQAGSSPICAMAVLPSVCQSKENWLALLAADGGLSVWDWRRGRCVKTIRGPRPLAPGSTNAAVPGRLEYWAEAGLLVYGATDGHIGLVGCHDWKLRTHPAQSRGSCICLPAGPALYTLGGDDGVLRAWSAQSQLGGIALTSTQCWRGPRDIVSGAVADDSFALVDRSGEAALYRLDHRELVRERRLNVPDCRVVAGATEARRRELVQTQRTAAAQELCDQIEDDLAGGRYDWAAQRCDALEATGFAVKGLTYRGRAAAYRQDVAGELAAQHRLLEVLGPVDASRGQVQARYVELLKGVGLYTAAHRACLVQHLAPQLGQRLEHLAALVEGGRAVNIPPQAADIRPTSNYSAGIQLCIEAASAIDHAFEGRWLLERSVGLLCRSPITPGQLADKYEQLRAMDGTRALPQAHDAQWWSIAAGTSRRVEGLIFGPAHEPVLGLKLAVEVEQDGLQSVLTRWLIFEFPAAAASMTPSEHNQEALAEVRRIQEAGPVAGVVRRACQLVAESAQRLINTARATASHESEEGL